MAEFAKGDVDPEYDEVDATLDAAGFTDWSADDDTSNITIEQGDNNKEGDGLYYAESVRSDQLVEIFVSPTGPLSDRLYSDLIIMLYVRFSP